MADRISNGAGTNFNTAANWDESVNAPGDPHASTNITVTSGGVTSATFTAPNTTNACTGVLVPVAAVGTAGNIIATLQENSAGWVDKASVTVSITSLIASTHVFFKFTTPYTFTATTANYYRIKLNTSGASGTTSIAANSGGANFWFEAFMNNNVVPTTGDNVWCISPNQGSSLLMELDTSPSFGFGTSTSVPTFRSYGHGLILANNGGIAWQAATSRTVTLKGNVLLERNGVYQQGSVATPIQVGVTAKLTFDQNGTSVNYGFVHLTGAQTIIQSTGLTYRKTTCVSGTGVTGNELVTSDTTGWSVNDELVFVPVSNNSTNYNESEVRFIKTITGTSITLSATAGGAESALTYSHTNGYVFNVTRSCVIDTTNTAQAWYADFSETTSAGNVNIDGARFETFGSFTTGKTTIVFSNIASELCELDDIVFYRNLGGNVTLGNNNDVRSYSWLIFYDAIGAAFTVSSLRNKTFNNLNIIKAASAGLAFNATASAEFNDCGFWACSTSSATSNGGLVGTNSPAVTLNRCVFHANRSYGISFSASVQFRLIDCDFGTLGYNGSGDVNVAADTYNTAVFIRCDMGSPTLVNNYQNAAQGTELAFHELNGTEMNHRWYTPNGIAYSSGAGLSDTTTVFTDHFSLKLAGENTTYGQSWEYKILARPDYFVNSYGIIRKNASMVGSDVVVEYYAPGLTPGIDTATATYTMPDNTSDNPYSLGALYTGNVYDFATVRIIAKTATSGAYAYVGKISNGTNPLIAMDTWYDGKPAQYMYPELGDPDSVWAVLTSSFTVSGTVGKLVKDVFNFILYLVSKAR